MCLFSTFNEQMPTKSMLLIFCRIECLTIIFLAESQREYSQVANLDRKLMCSFTCMYCFWDCKQTKLQLRQKPQTKLQLRQKKHRQFFGKKPLPSVVLCLCLVLPMKVKGPLEVDKSWGQQHYQTRTDQVKADWGNWATILSPSMS